MSEKERIMSMRNVNQFAYIYMAGKDIINKVNSLEEEFSKDGLKRMRTAVTHLDKAFAEVLATMGRETYRQLEFYIRTHEVCMIPQQDKFKYMKNLQKQEHLINIRSVVVKAECNDCKKKDSSTCKTKKMLEECGTPYFYEMDELDTLPEEERKNAEHCGYCGGVGE